MGTKMSNAPVYYTVAQVQFNPVLSLESFLPVIQDQMRTKHFPDFKREVFQRVILPFGPGDGGQTVTPSVVAQSRFTFGNMEGSSSFILENNALSFQTTAYDTFEIFSKALVDGLNILNETLKLDFTERVGLRYLDAILPKAQEESLSNYLASEVLGLTDKLDGKLAHSVSETVTFNNAGQLVSRVIIQNGRVGLPPEMAAMTPQINPRFTQPEGLHAIIDADAFYQGREAFDLSKLENRLSALHDEILKSFNATVTPFALKAWS